MALASSREANLTVNHNSMPLEVLLTCSINTASPSSRASTGGGIHGRTWPQPDPITPRTYSGEPTREKEVIHCLALVQ
jgi:hypothetical protein